ncbi:MAG: TGS domain-containing protein [Oscillospiraceae bacterium]
MLKIKLKDGNIIEVAKNTTVADTTKQISMGLFRNACCGKIDGKVVDLRDQITKDCSLEICTFDHEDGKKTFWHTASHILAQAVKSLYPQAKLAIGPAIDGGFYYDFKITPAFTTEDLEKIEAQMKKIVKEDISLEKVLMPANEAITYLEELDEPFKIELAKEHSAKGEQISFYKQGDFSDLCAGPH